MNIQNANELNIVDGNVIFSSKNHLMTESSSQVYMQTREKNIFDKERY